MRKENNVKKKMGIVQFFHHYFIYPCAIFNLTDFKEVPYIMNDNRRKLTGILKLLYENTDAEHSMDTYQIMDALESIGYGRPDRKTIDANIRYLIEDMGFGIVKEKGKPNRYRWIEREFDISELEAISSAIHASRFISKKKGREIIAKLKDLTSIHQAALLDGSLYTCNYYKHEGSYSLKAAEMINECIKSKRRITFQMAAFDMYKNEILSSNGKVFEVSPFALVWNNDYCYMTGKVADSAVLQSFRIDRMRNVSQSHIAAELPPADFNADQYSSRVFDMFEGSLTDVELACAGHTMGALIDRFGRDFYTERRSEDSFTARVYTDTNPAFYAWVFQFGGDITIQGPAEVKAEYNSMLLGQLK